MIIRTTRDLYQSISELIATHQNTKRSLEEYLRSLWSISRNYRNQPSLSASEFLELLTQAFIQPAPPFDKAWITQYQDESTNREGYPRWESRIRRQIVDLYEMKKKGTLQDELRYFGIDSPRGQRWYNFDPRTFLECATVGSFGGWEEGDDTGREYVPGPVAVMDSSGQIQERDPREIEDPIQSILEITWDDFRYFLGQGQWYE
jgi:hypothetical protein